MNRQTIGAMNENYDVAMLTGHKVMYNSDSLKGDSVQQTCIISFRVIIACIFAHRKSGVIVDFAETRIAT